jgi:hypothetical protein
MTHKPGSGADAEHIVGTALTAFRQGAGRIGTSAAAIEALREQFIHKIWSALEQPDWHEDWQREQAYLRACAVAMGARARVLATDDRRREIAPQDIEGARIKLRGYMPIAGRWWPS